MQSPEPKADVYDAAEAELNQKRRWYALRREHELAHPYGYHTPEDMKRAVRRAQRWHKNQNGNRPGLVKNVPGHIATTITMVERIAGERS